MFYNSRLKKENELLRQANRQLQSERNQVEQDLSLERTEVKQWKSKYYKLQDYYKELQAKVIQSERKRDAKGRFIKKA